jgi:hypothetical protein
MGLYLNQLVASEVIKAEVAICEYCGYDFESAANVGE